MVSWGHKAVVCYVLICKQDLTVTRVIVIMYNITCSLPELLFVSNWLKIFCWFSDDNQIIDVLALCMFWTQVTRWLIVNPSVSVRHVMTCGWCGMGWTHSQWVRTTSELVVVAEVVCTEDFSPHGVIDCWKAPVWAGGQWCEGSWLVSSSPDCHLVMAPPQH